MPFSACSVFIGRILIYVFNTSLSIFCQVARMFKHYQYACYLAVAVNSPIYLSFFPNNTSHSGPTWSSSAAGCSCHWSCNGYTGYPTKYAQCIVMKFLLQLRNMLMGIMAFNLPVFFKIASLALGQSMMTSSNENILSYWPFVQGIHRSPVNSPHKGQWHGALMFSLICVWINSWVNNREAGDLRCYRAHYDAIAMHMIGLFHCQWSNPEE